MINFLGADQLHTDTYWRVIEHPWNGENQLAGLFTEMEWETSPDVPLYDVEPLGNSRLYLLDGDLSAGTANIVRDWEWDPRKPDSTDSHPSIGKNRYLVFEVASRDTVYDDTLTILGFTPEQGRETGCQITGYHTKESHADPSKVHGLRGDHMIDLATNDIRTIRCCVSPGCSTRLSMNRDALPACSPPEHGIESAIRSECQGR